MKNLRIRALLKGCVLAFFTSPNFVLAQITFTSNDLLGMIGSRQVTLDDRRFSIPVDVGSPGANQVWDFRSQIIGDTLFSVTEYLSPAMIPNSADFPGMNLAQRITTADAPGSEFFNFFQITSTLFIDVGDSAKLTDGGLDTTFVSVEDDTVASLPINFNDSWMTTDTDTTGTYPAFATITIDTAFNTVDGWGTLRLPLGDFECLRLRQDEKTISMTIVNGTVVNSGVESDIQYDWIGKNSTRLAFAQSQPGETNPNFTDARGFGRLDSLSTSPSTGVADAPEAPSGFQLFQNYPNPFNPVTSIRYSVTGDQIVSLKVFDTVGREVATLVDERQAPGVYRVQFDAEGLPSGIYFARMAVGRRQVTTRKMLLVE